MINNYCLPNALPTIHMPRALKEIKSIYDIPVKAHSIGLKGNKITTPVTRTKLRPIDNKRHAKANKNKDDYDEECNDKLKKIDSVKLRIIRNYIRRYQRTEVRDTDYNDTMYKSKPNVIFASKTNMVLGHTNTQKNLTIKLPKNLYVPKDLMAELTK